MPIIDLTNLFADVPDTKVEYTGTIMSGNTEVAEVQNGVIVDFDSLAPLYIQRTRDFESWLLSRAVDSHRSHSRILKKMLRLSNLDDSQAVLKAHAATITDNYWFRGKGEFINYNDVRFSTDTLYSVALYGNQDVKVLDTRTPELTNIGSYEKCWKLRNKKWVLIKHGTPAEIASELFACYLGNSLCFNMAQYVRSKESGCIESQNFVDTKKYNFEPMYSIVGDSVDYNFILSKLEILGQEFVDDMLDILYLDAIIRNPDRHTFNYGVLRDVHNGVITKLAPNFDNNLSLVATGIPKNLNRNNDMLIRELLGLKYWTNRNRHYQPTWDKLSSICLLSGITALGCQDSVMEFVMNGINAISAGSKQRR